MTSYWPNIFSIRVSPLILTKSLIKRKVYKLLIMSNILQQFNTWYRFSEVNIFFKSQKASQILTKRLSCSHFVLNSLRYQTTINLDWEHVEVNNNKLKKISPSRLSSFVIFFPPHVVIDHNSPPMKAKFSFEH